MAKRFLSTSKVEHGPAFQLSPNPAPCTTTSTASRVQLSRNALQLASISCFRRDRWPRGMHEVCLSLESGLGRPRRDGRPARPKEPTGYRSSTSMKPVGEDRARPLTCGRGQCAELSETATRSRRQRPAGREGAGGHFPVALREALQRDSLAGDAHQLSGMGRPPSTGSRAHVEPDLVRVQIEELKAEKNHSGGGTRTHNLSINSRAHLPN